MSKTYSSIFKAKRKAGKSVVESHCLAEREAQLELFSSDAQYELLYDKYKFYNYNINSVR